MTAKIRMVLHILGLYLDKVEKAFQIDSQELGNIYRERGKDLNSAGRHEQAVAICQKAVAIDENDVEAQYQLGVAYMGNRIGE